MCKEKIHLSFSPILTRGGRDLLEVESETLQGLESECYGVKRGETHGQDVNGILKELRIQWLDEYVE